MQISNSFSRTPRYKMSLHSQFQDLLSSLSKSLAALNLQNYNQPVAHRMLLAHLSSLESTDPAFEKYSLVKAIRREIELKFGEQLASSDGLPVTEVVREVTESRRWEDFCERLLGEILTEGKQGELGSSDSEVPIAVEKLPAIEELKSIMSDMSARQRSKALAALQHFNPSDLILQ